MIKSKLFSRSGTLFLAVIVLTAMIRPQSGGGFVITQSVIANGGRTSMDAGNVFSLTGTIGQPKAGDNSTGSPFNVLTGFWTPFLGPTAADASISGRVTVNGRGLPSLQVVLRGGSLAQSRTVLTNQFGHYQFAAVPVGQTYVVSVPHRRYVFANQIVTLTDDMTGVNFPAR
jgi:hypothetical protein